jgi:hypothetical protein
LPLSAVVEVVYEAWPGKIIPPKRKKNIFAGHNQRLSGKITVVFNQPK